MEYSNKDAYDFVKFLRQTAEGMRRFSPVPGKVYVWGDNLMRLKLRQVAERMESVQPPSQIIKFLDEDRLQEAGELLGTGEKMTRRIKTYWDNFYFRNRIVKA